MNLHSFKVGRTQACFFTKVQKSKLEAGLDVLVEVLGSKFFANRILHFEWKNQEQRRFYRFYHANGLSNRQVLQRILGHKLYFNELGSNEQLTILPYSNRKEIQNHKSRNNPVIWISLSCIQNDWYTPIHIASAIAHELAVLLGLDSSTHQYSRLEYQGNKVPEFLGSLIMETAALWKDSVTVIEDSFQQIDEKQYNYFPASIVLGSLSHSVSTHNQSNFENLISSLLIEQAALIILQENLTVSETARLVCIEEVLLNLNRMKAMMAESTLDGSGLDYQKKSTPNGGSRRSN